MLLVLIFRLGGSSHRGFLYYSNYCVCMYVFNTSATYILGSISRSLDISDSAVSYDNSVCTICMYIILQQGSFPHRGLAVEERGSLSVLFQLLLLLLPLIIFFFYFCFFVRCFLRVSDHLPGEVGIAASNYLYWCAGVCVTCGIAAAAAPVYGE